MEYLWIVVAGILVNNFVLSKFLGICPFLGVSKKTETAFGMGLAVVFVMSISSVITFVLYKYVLIPLELEYMKTIVFILVIASLVQIVEIVLKRFSPSLHAALGVYLPLITTNCAVLGVALINVTLNGLGMLEYNLLQAFLNGVASGIGFTLAIILLAGIRERVDRVKVPAPFKGFPITLITASIMAMAFAGFASLVF